MSDMLAYYAWEIAPILLGLFAMFMLRALKRKGNAIRIITEAPVEPWSTSTICKQLADRPMTCGELATASGRSSAAVVPALAADASVKAVWWNGYAYASNESIKEAVLRRLAGDHSIINGLRPEATVPIRTAIAGLNMLDITNKDAFSTSPANNKAIHLFRQQSDSARDMMTVFGSRKGGALLHYMVSDKIEWV